jgi:hypothetical protein
MMLPAFKFMEIACVWHGPSRMIKNSYGSNFRPKFGRCGPNVDQFFLCLSGSRYPFFTPFLYELCCIAEHFCGLLQCPFAPSSSALKGGDSYLFIYLCLCCIGR